MKVQEEHVRSLIGGMCDQSIWSDWRSLCGCWRGSHVPSCSGTYRIRLAGAADLLYVGETANLKKRLAMLKPVYGEVIPYRSPHVIGPHLYALRQTLASPFEVSFATLDVNDQVRKGLEALVIAQHRQQFVRSPAANFGRMPLGWKASSSNTAILVAKGLRYRGGRTTQCDESHLPGIPPLAPLVPADPEGSVWGGHIWSAWTNIPSTDLGEARGLYRLRRYPSEILAVGCGKIADRLKEYCKLDIEYSWIAGPWLHHQQLELICDLVASYLLIHAAPPRAQFGSLTKRRNATHEPDIQGQSWWQMALASIGLSHEIHSQQEQYSCAG